MTSAEIKYVKSLSRKKFRDQYGVFTAEGEKLVEEALSSGFEVEKVYRTADIGEAVMARITGLSSPSPALAVIRCPADINNGDVPAKGLFLALDGIRDPGNLGTIIRTADWFGIDAVFCSPDTVDCFNPKVVQATMGAIFRVKIHYTPIPDFCKAVIKAGGRVFGTFLEGKNIYESDLYNGEDTPSAIIVGNEANGISPQTAACVSDRIFIPPFAGRSSESLNAAVATAITVAEFRRRLQK